MIADLVRAEAASAPPPPTASTAVFDFDGTLVSRDSFLDFSFRYCVRRPVRWLTVALTLPLAGLLRLRSLRSAASVLLWAMTVGTSTRQFVGALKNYAKVTLPAYANEAIFAELTRHRRAGDRVLIATGTLPLLVRGLLDVRGCPRLPVVGSRVLRKWGGLVVTTHCTGRVKLYELKRRYRVEDWTSVYTDSFADAPLVSRARDVTLVSPSSRTLSRTQQLVGTRAALRVLQPRPR